VTLKQVKNHLRVFKMCYVKAPSSIIGLTFFSLFTVIISLLYNLYAGKIIDTALTVAGNHGDFSQILVPLAIFMSLLFFVSISESVKTFFEVLYNNTIDLIMDEYKNNELPTTLRSGFTVARASLALHLSDLASPRTYLLHPH